jgi:hypothetical protein
MDPETLSRLMSSSEGATKLVEQSNESERTIIKDDGTLDKYYKLEAISDLILSEHFESQYGLKNIGYSNISDLYNPLKTLNFDFFD